MQAAPERGELLYFRKFSISSRPSHDPLAVDRNLTQERVNQSVADMTEKTGK